MNYFRCIGQRSEKEIVILDSVIPRMTSDTTPSGECSASYVYSDRYAYYGFTTNGNGSIDYGSTFWYNDSAGNYLQYTFDEVKTLYKIGFGTINNNYVNFRFKFQFSTDGVTFIDGDTFTVESGAWTWYDLSATKTCIAFRIYMIDNISVVSGVDAYGFVGSGGMTTLLKGTTTPTSAQGSNGQIYLKYDEYDYDTFMNDKIIVQINKNDNTDKKMFFVGLEKDANDISITDNDLLSYLSDVTNGYKKAGYSYSQNQVRNGNIGFYNLGDGVKLRSWSIDWTTLGNGTYYSLLDLNEPATSASESSGQTNIYVPSYYDSTNIISSTYLKVNNSWQNLIGSDIDDIGNTTKMLIPIDMSTFTRYRESSMWYVGISNILASAWDGGQNIGANCYLTNPIDVTNINKLYYELETKNCYGGGSTAAQARWNVMIGLMQTAPSGIVQVAYDSAGFVAGDDFANSNTNYGTQEIDVSNLTGNYYFVMVSHGWNASISNLRYK